ncbi:MAG: hypothetical protein NTZ33_12695 [Bacteroidetes bacterium]|nr:hypothetical protein [Bacteroidota bacterium]
MNNILYKLIIAVILLFSGIKANAQPYLIDNAELPKLKKSKLYVILDTKTGKDDKYYDIFKEVWNYCPYKIIEPSEVLDHLNPDVFFMNLHITVLEHKFESTQKLKFFQIFELKIWKITPYYLKKMDRKKFKIEDINFAENSIAVARIKLKADDSRRFYIEDIMKESDFMGSPYLLYTEPAILKNYLKYLQTILKKNLFYKEKESVYNEEEIARLKKSTLYIPETLLNEYEIDKESKDKNKIDKKYDPKEVFEGYPGKYELISLNDLNDRILKSDETFYYVNVYLNYDWTYSLVLTITNSNTGEIIFKESCISMRSFPLKLIKHLTEKMKK